MSARAHSYISYMLHMHGRNMHSSVYVCVCVCTHICIMSHMLNTMEGKLICVMCYSRVALGIYIGSLVLFVFGGLFPLSVSAHPLL